MYTLLQTITSNDCLYQNHMKHPFQVHQILLKDNKITKVILDIIYLPTTLI